MRIVKEQALALLRAEIADLGEQCRRSERQIAKLSSWGLDAMSGKAVSAAERRIRMQAAMARAQLALFQSLREADRRNAQLVEALPTTSPGVLDTAQADDRIWQARQAIRRLTRERDWLMSIAEPAAKTVLWWRYQRRIDAEWRTVKDNQKILEKAGQYGRDSLNVYQGVAVASVEQAQKSADGYELHGDWGSTTWAGTIFFERDVNVFRGKEEARALQKGPVEKFMDGDLNEHANMLSGKAEVRRPASTQVAEGEILGLSVSVGPYQTQRVSADSDTPDVGVGVKAKTGFSVAKGSVAEDTGMLASELSGSLVTVGVSGSLGASLSDGENPGPTFAAKAEVDASAASVGAKTQLGDRDFNTYAKLDGEALSFSSEAGVEYADSQVEVCVGAEAYVAQGKISGGITFLGINVDASVQGMVGGAGGKAGAEVGTHAIGGELSLGLGIGVGAKVRVDWSGLFEACKNLRNTVADWWDSLTKRKDEEDV